MAQLSLPRATDIFSEIRPAYMKMLSRFIVIGSESKKPLIARSPQHERFRASHE